MGESLPVYRDTWRIGYQQDGWRKPVTHGPLFVPGETMRVTWPITGVLWIVNERTTPHTS